MTDKEKLDNIATEIERRKKLHEDSLINPIHKGFGLQNVIKAKIRELTYLHSFIDSMQKEAKKEAAIKVEQIMAEVDAKFPKFAKDVKDMQEEPVSEDLKKEIQEYYDSRREYGGKYNAVIPVYRHQLADIARHFVNWQKQKAVKWLKSNINCDMWINDFIKSMEG